MLGSRANPSPLSALDDPSHVATAPAQLLRKTGQPTTASPRTAENNRQKLGGFLTSFGFGGSPLRRLASRGSSVTDHGQSQLRQDNASAVRIGSEIRSFEERMAALGLGGAASTSNKKLDWEEDETGTINGRDTTSFPLFQLPDEILLQILSHLPPTVQQLHNLSLVCRHMHALSLAPVLWARAFDATPGFKLDPFAREHGVAVSDAPMGEWDGASWSQASDAAQSIKENELNCHDHPQATPIHFPTLYRSRAALGKQIRSPAQHPPHVVTLTEHTDAVYCVHSAKQWLVTGSRDRSIRIWRLPSVVQKMEEVTLVHSIAGAHEGSVLGLRLELHVDEGVVESHSASGQKGSLVSCSSDGTAVLWDIELGTRADHGNSATTTSDDTVQLEKIGTLRNHEGPVLDVVMTRKHIVTCGRDRSIRVYDRPSLTQLHVLCGHAAPVNCLALCPMTLPRAGREDTGVEGANEMEDEETMVASVSGDGQWIIWDLVRGEEIRKSRTHGRGLACVAWEGDHLVTGDNDGNVNIYSASTGAVLPTRRRHDDLVRAIAIDPHAGHLITGSYDKTLRLWDTESDKMVVLPQQGRKSPVFDVDLRTNRLISACQDGSVQVSTWGCDLPYARWFA